MAYTYVMPNVMKIPWLRLLQAKNTPKLGNQTIFLKDEICPAIFS